MRMWLLQEETGGSRKRTTNFGNYLSFCFYGWDVNFVFGKSDQILKTMYPGYSFFTICEEELRFDFISM